MKDAKELRESLNNSNFTSKVEKKCTNYAETWYRLDFDKGFPEGEIRIVNLEELKKVLEDTVQRIDNARKNNSDLNYVVVKNNRFTPDYKVEV